MTRNSGVDMAGSGDGSNPENAMIAGHCGRSSVGRASASQAGRPRKYQQISGAVSSVTHLRGLQGFRAVIGRVHWEGEICEFHA